MLKSEKTQPSKRHIPRIYVDAHIEPEVLLHLEGDLFHHLIRVLRLSRGDPIHIFNAQQGEWDTHIESIEKHSLSLKILGLNRSVHQSPTPEIHVCFSLLKPAPEHLIFEKATELGASHLHPLIMERTQGNRTQAFKIDKAKRICIEASEQCDRLSIPEIHHLEKLETFLEKVRTQEKDNFLIIFCDESLYAAAINNHSKTKDKEQNDTASSPSLLDLKAQLTHVQKVFVLIGPEGGFTAQEQQRIKDLPQTHPILLTKTILKAETAALTILAQLSLVL